MFGGPCVGTTQPCQCNIAAILSGNGQGVSGISALGFVAIWKENTNLRGRDALLSSIRSRS